MPCPQVSGRLFWCAAATLLAAVTVNAQTTWHVDRDSPSDGPGHDWEHAYHYLQNALAVAGAGDTIRVAEGTHRPDESTADPTGTGLRTATFQLVSGVTLEGGYAGYGAADPDERDIELYPTTLSGDIGTEGSNADNSYHVTTGSGTDATAVLDGFTITAGNADDYGSGAGMCNESGSPSVANCTFSGNSARWSGGGMCNGDSSATIDDCTFLENAASGYGGGMANFGGNPTVTGCMFSGNVTGGPPHYDEGFGGGMHNYGSSPTVIGCAFSANIAAGFQPGTGAGGGMCNHSSAPVVVNCAFAGNQGYEGAGMHNRYDSSPQITDCTFIRNVATLQDTGAGMHNEASSPVLTNCTFVGNTGAGSPCECSNVGGMLNRAGSNPVVTNSVFAGNQGCVIGGMLNEGSVPIVANCTFSGNVGLFYGAIGGDGTVVNSIFWGNGSWSEIVGVTATYSDIKGGYAGTGNIDADPLFVRNPDPGSDGEWGTADDDYGDLRLQAASPCIDAADNTAVPSDTADLDDDADTTERTPLDLDFHRRFVDDPDTADTGIADPPDYPDVVDMGAYEFQVPVFGDLDGDFDVDGNDFAIFADCMSGPDVSCAPDCDVADLDGDADADLHDFMLFQQQFTGPLP